MDSETETRIINAALAKLKKPQSRGSRSRVYEESTHFFILTLTSEIYRKSHFSERPPIKILQTAKAALAAIEQVLEEGEDSDE